MDKFIISGGTPLKGTIPVSGSKNGALPLMAAAILADGPTTISNVPRLRDIYTFNNVLRVTGARVDFDEKHNTLTVDPANVNYLEAPYDLVRKMRASFYMLGALLGRYGQAKVSLPGGCAWGPRPVNLHMEGLRALGAQLDLEGGYVVAKVPHGGLHGTRFRLDPSSVGATVNITMGAVFAKGTTIIDNAAMEPDVVDLCVSLNKMGAKISGMGSTTLTIEGVDSLKGKDLKNSPDRIEAGTFMIAAAMHPDSEVTLSNVRPEHLGTFPDAYRKTGAQLTIDEDQLHIKAPGQVQPVSIKTQVYPGFPTDLQAQWATLMTQAAGPSIVTDNIYLDRFSYVPELLRMGAKMEVDDNRVEIYGPTKLNGASVMSTDLRASVSLVIAAMVADGSSEVLRVYHLDRGYEALEHKLNEAGAKIERIGTNEMY